jgi:hypothetical protein
MVSIRGINGNPRHPCHPQRIHRSGTRTGHGLRIYVERSGESGSTPGITPIEPGHSDNADDVPERLGPRIRPRVGSAGVSEYAVPNRPLLERIVKPCDQMYATGNPQRMRTE